MNSFGGYRFRIDLIIHDAQRGTVTEESVYTHSVDVLHEMAKILGYVLDAASDENPEAGEVMSDWVWSEEDPDPQRVYTESEKYAEWEAGDTYRTLARIELVAREALEYRDYVTPAWLLHELGFDA